MRILFITEGTYPQVMGGVSTWCDQLIRGLSQHRFSVLAITGPLPVPMVMPRPSNVEGLIKVPIWRPRDGLVSASRQDLLKFDQAFSTFLGFLDGDLPSYAQGLEALASLGHEVDLWPLFERRSLWRMVQAQLRRQLPYTPTLAEMTLCVNWLKSALVPLLFIPAKTDLVHTVSNGLGAIPAWLAAKAHGIPLVLTEHGVYLRERYLAFSDEGDTPALKYLRSRFYNSTARLMYNQADSVLSVSEFNRQWQLELGAAAEKTKVIPNGVKVESLEHLARPAKRPTVVWVGRIDPLKDLETLLQAFHQVTAERPEAQLLLYGPVPKGNERYQQVLQALVRDLDLEQSVKFCGPISPVYKAFEEADVMALSSISEGFPYTIIEGMMAALPIVATRVGGVGEALANTGLLVPAQKPEAFAAALLELLHDPERRRSLGLAARKRALNHFTLDRMLASYEATYQRLVSPATLSYDNPVIMLKNGPDLAEETILLRDNGQEKSL